MKKSFVFLVFVTFMFLLNGCSDKQNITIKPYPQYHSSKDQIIFQEKEIWNQELNSDIKDFKQFTKSTIDDIKKYKQYLRIKYGVDKKKQNKRFFIDEDFINEQYR